MGAVRVTVYDVGPRDGLQNEPRSSTSRTAQSSSGGSSTPAFPRVEIASFVDPRRVPQMSGAEEVVAAVGHRAGVVRAGLALNERATTGCSRPGLDEVRFAFGVTESFNRRNQGAPVEESIATARRIAARARGDGLRVHRHAERRLRLPVRGRGRSRARAQDRGAKAARSSRTRSSWPTPSASRVPGQVRCARRRASRELGTAVGGHFHNTRNTGYANALAALEAGATVLDASVGGLGGCPFAPRATGNIATEDLVYLLERRGRRDGHRPRRPDRGLPLARGDPRAAARRPALPRGSVPRYGADTGGAGSTAHLAEFQLAGVAAQDDLVAVLEERPRRAVGGDRSGARRSRSAR